MHDSLDAAKPARLAFRRLARRLLRAPLNAVTHMARLQAALDLPGSEPVQGALADLYVTFGPTDAPLKQQALALAHNRLAAHHARFFEAQAAQAALTTTNPLATRWSVLARPSADISSRARRCSVDDSKALAAHMVLAVERDDTQAQQEFLHHCITCHDNLAFMLARRALRHAGAGLSAQWEAVSQQLQQPQVLA